MLLITFVELRVLAGRSRTRASSPQAVSRRTCCAVALRRTAWHGRGIASVNQTRPHCVNRMGKTHSKPLAARHGRGTAWARRAICASALRATKRDTTHLVLTSQKTSCLYFKDQTLMQLGNNIYLL
jgi:hypothetical protein